MLTGIGGPVVGGLAFGFLGLVPIVVACVVCFAASAVVAALTVRVPYEPPARTAGALATARADLAEALSFLRSSPLMWRTILGATLVNLFGSSFFNVCSPYIVTETLGLPNQLMGALQGALAVGGLAGGAVVAAAPGRFSIRSVPGLLACVAGGIALIAGALASPLPVLGTFGALAALYLPTMAACMCMSVVATSWLQTESPAPSWARSWRLPSCWRTSPRPWVSSATEWRSTSSPRGPSRSRQPQPPPPSRPGSRAPRGADGEGPPKRQSPRAATPAP